MILVTGGAGFIGSILQAALRRRGHETIVVDRLRDAGKWRNLRNHPPSRLLAPEDLDGLLADQPPNEMVFHLRAISATTASDCDLTCATNVEVPAKLLHLCAALGV